MTVRTVVSWVDLSGVTSVTGTLAVTEANDTLAAVGVIVGEQPPIFGGGGGGIYYPPPVVVPVEGFGYGILPQVEGEAFGLVVGVGAGVGVLPGLAGAGAGTIVVVGRTAARLAIKTTAHGERGQTGAAVAILKAVPVGSGSVVVRGAGAGTIRVDLEGSAVGQHDDDDDVAAIMTLLLAA